MSFGKLIGNKYTVAGFIGAAVAGGYDVASNRRTSAGEVLADMGAGAGVAMLGTKGASSVKSYFEKFEMGALAKEASNRTLKENAAELASWGAKKAVGMGRAVGEDIFSAGFRNNVLIGGGMSAGMDLMNGERDAGKITRAAMVGGVLGGVAYTTRIRMLGKYEGGMQRAMDNSAIFKPLTHSDTMKTIGTGIAIGGVEGALNASWGRQDNSPIGGATVGAVGGGLDVLATVGILGATRFLAKSKIIDPKHLEMSFKEALEVEGNPILKYASLGRTIDSVAKMSPEARQMAKKNLKEGLENARNFLKEGTPLPAAKPPKLDTER